MLDAASFLWEVISGCKHDARFKGAPQHETTLRPTVDVELVALPDELDVVAQEIEVDANFRRIDEHSASLKKV